MTTYRVREAAQPARRQRRHAAALDRLRPPDRGHRRRRTARRRRRRPGPAGPGGRRLGRATPARPVASESARNRFTGLVTRVQRDGVMAQVEPAVRPAPRGVADEPRGRRRAWGSNPASSPSRP
nr:hypothetical protein [Angustibacter aerolatus]